MNELKELKKYLYGKADIVRDYVINSLKQGDLKAYKIHNEELQSIYDLIDELERGEING